MDNPNLGVHELKKVFKDINRVNNLLGGSKISLNALWKLIKDCPKESYTILDMGCGDGFMLRKAALFLRKCFAIKTRQISMRYTALYAYHASF